MVNKCERGVRMGKGGGGDNGWLCRRGWVVLPGIKKLAL